MKDIPLYEVRNIKNLKEMLSSSAVLYADNPAFFVKTKKGDVNYTSVSYSQFKKDVDAFGTALLSLGLKGKRIALIGETRYEWNVSYLASVNGTGVIVPLDKELPENEIKNLLIRSQANALVFSGNLKENISDIIGKISTIKHYICMDDIKDERHENVLTFKNLLAKGYDLINSGDMSFTNSEIDNSALCSLIFTSGTTELSKAVMLSHHNICSNLMDMCSMVHFDTNDIFLSILPLHHTYECTCGFLCPIYRGAAVAHCEGLRHIQKNLKESGATLMLGVPLIFEAMYKKIWDQASKKSGLVLKLKSAIVISNFLKGFGIDISKKLFSQLHENFGGKIKLLISGAAPIDPLVSKGFRDIGINFLQGYGLTECSPIVALNRDVDFKDNSAGIPLPGLEIKIENPDADGIGEILVKGHSVMLGYYDNPEATEKALKGDWFFTGDAGYLDDDKFLFITGRKKNVIVTKNGKKIFPEEIEMLLNQSKYIKESIVYGKESEDGDDTLVSCTVVPDMDNLQQEFKNGVPSPDDIYKLIWHEVKTVNKGLTNYKHIKQLHLQDNEFIKTTTKKIKRYEVNKL